MKNIITSILAITGILLTGCHVYIKSKPRHTPKHHRHIDNPKNNKPIEKKQVTNETALKCTDEPAPPKSDKKPVKDMDWYDNDFAELLKREEERKAQGLP